MIILKVMSMEKILSDASKTISFRENKNEILVRNVLYFEKRNFKQTKIPLLKSEINIQLQLSSLKYI